MRRAAIDLLRRRWWLPVALVLAPKCLLCLLAWAGLALGLGGVELCGAP